MQSIFLEGLKTARELVKEKGVEALDSLIAEHELGTIETAALKSGAETR